MAQVMKVAGIGTNFVFAIIGMGLLGWALDYWLKTSPWCLLSGLFVGLIGGGYRFIREGKMAATLSAEQVRQSGATFRKIEDPPDDPEDADHKAP
jgi:F0F1-type ATP synthase assembly protein I